MKNSVLILGIGNYLMGDEGVGVHIARAFAEDYAHENIDIVDGGTGGFLLLEYLESYPTVIMIDATLDDLPAGTIQMIKPRFSADFPKAMSTHEVGLKDLVESLQLLGKLPNIYLFTVSIDKVQPLSIELSEEIKFIVPMVLKQVWELAVEEAEPVVQKGELISIHL